MMISTMPILPTLDISPFLADPSSDASEEFVRELREACHGPGFCYLVGHGNPSELDQAMMETANRFFALPDDQRRQIAIGNSPHFRGYTILGDERTAGKSDWRDQIDFGPEEPALRLGADDPPWLRLRGPNQWPSALPDMRDTVVEWMRTMDVLGIAVMRALALGLGQAMSCFDATLTPEPYQRLKVMRYPAQSQPTDTGQGLGLHHDSGLLSFVFQDEVGGLQVQIDDETLVDVTHKPGAYVMNLGEMLQAASSGYLRATKHRVESPPPGKQRISIAYFMNPRLDAVFEPFQLPAALAKQASGGQNANTDDPVFSSFGYNTLKIRMRAHPDVASAFYADVGQLSSTG